MYVICVMYVLYVMYVMYVMYVVYVSYVCDAVMYDCMHVCMYGCFQCNVVQMQCNAVWCGVVEDTACIFVCMYCNCSTRTHVNE